MTTLGEVCAELVDCEHKTAPIAMDGEFFAVGTPAMKGNVINYDEARRISHETFLAWTRRLAPRAGDILFAREAPVGPVVRIPPEENVAPGQRTVLMRIDPQRADPFYVYQRLTGPDVQGRIHERAAGSTVPHLNVPDIKAFELGELPSLKEQRAIAEVLGALDDKIAANGRGLTIAGELAAAIFRGALSGETRQLSTVADVVMGSSPKGETLNELGDGVVFQQGVRDFGVRSPGHRVWTTSPVRMAKPGDTLVSVRAPVGLVNVAREAVCVGRGLAAVRSLDAKPWCLFHALRSVREVWELFEATGTVFGSITGPQLKALDVPVIADDAGTVEARLASLEERIAGWLKENEKLAALRDALLPELMSGRLTVKDAESQVEEVV